MHGEERRWVDEAIQTNWVSTVGENINEVERMVAEKVGCNYAVAPLFWYGCFTFSSETVW